MRPSRHLLLAATGALVALVACAKIAGLEDPDPSARGGDGEDTGTGPQSSAQVAVSPASVSLDTSCAGGGDRATAHVTIENKASTDADYELEVPEGSAFALRDAADASVGKLTGKIPANGVVLVYLRATPTRAGTFDGQVIVRVGGYATQVPVKVTVDGGALAISPNLVDFGEVRQQTTSAPQTIEIENTGTKPVNLLGLATVPPGGASADFTVDLGAGSVNIAPGQKATATVTLAPGPAGPPVSAVLEPTTQEPTCGELPKLTVQGTRVNQDVTVNPVALDFGEVPCVSAGGATKTITVSNYANVAASFTVSAAASAWFDVAADALTVPPANGSTPSTRTITVTLKPVGQGIGSHVDPIEIDVTSPNPKKTTATATVKSVGGIIEASPLTLSGFRPDQSKRSFAVRNTGNKYVYVRHFSTNANAFVVSGSTDETPLTAGAILPVSVEVNFVAQGNGAHQADIITEKTDPPILVPAGGNVCSAQIVKVSGMR